MPRTFTEDEVQELIEAAVVPFRARIAESEAEVARLQKDSSTSLPQPA